MPGVARLSGAVLGDAMIGAAEAYKRQKPYGRRFGIINSI